MIFKQQCPKCKVIRECDRNGFASAHKPWNECDCFAKVQGIPVVILKCDICKKMKCVNVLLDPNDDQMCSDCWKDMNEAMCPEHEEAMQFDPEDRTGKQEMFDQMQEDGERNYKSDTENN